MACFAKGIKFIFQISVLISKCPNLGTLVTGWGTCCTMYRYMFLAVHHCPLPVSMDSGLTMAHMNIEKEWERTRQSSYKFSNSQMEQIRKKTRPTRATSARSATRAARAIKATLIFYAFTLFMWFKIASLNCYLATLVTFKSRTNILVCAQQMFFELFHDHTVHI